jgi:hypothetical protein
MMPKDVHKIGCFRKRFSKKETEKTSDNYPKSCLDNGVHLTPLLPEKVGLFGSILSGRPATSYTPDIAVSIRTEIATYEDIL